ncbi:MAG: dTDP-4-dehydrorhamnose 3,5-epimerase [Pseudomonadota bacterium]
MTQRFDISATELAGLRVIKRRPIGDARGYLQRMFCVDELAAAGWLVPVAQVNHTYTKRAGSVRGLHLQLPPLAEMKLITCIRGEVWDVAVDLRANSATFLRWHAVHLSAENKTSYLIPPGFAHGFQTLTDEVEMLYCHSQVYTPSSEMGLNAWDKKLNISWPMTITDVSEKDKNWPMLDDSFPGINV